MLVKINTNNIWAFFVDILFLKWDSLDTVRVSVGVLHAGKLIFSVHTYPAVPPAFLTI